MRLLLNVLLFLWFTSRSSDTRAPQSQRDTTWNELGEQFRASRRTITGCSVALSAQGERSEPLEEAYSECNGFFVLLYVFLCSKVTVQAVTGEVLHHFLTFD